MQKDRETKNQPSKPLSSLKPPDLGSRQIAIGLPDREGSKKRERSPTQSRTHLDALFSFLEVDDVPDSVQVLWVPTNDTHGEERPRESEREGGVRREELRGKIEGNNRF